VEFNVRANNGRETRVQFRYNSLTPKSAIAAANIAFGEFSHCDVSARVSGQFKQYRVTGRGRSRRARRVR